MTLSGWLTAVAKINAKSSSLLVYVSNGINHTAINASRIIKGLKFVQSFTRSREDNETQEFQWFCDNQEQNIKCACAFWYTLSLAKTIPTKVRCNTRDLIMINREMVISLCWSCQRRLAFLSFNKSLSFWHCKSGFTGTRMKIRNKLFTVTTKIFLDTGTTRNISL